MRKLEVGGKMHVLGSCVVFFFLGTNFRVRLLSLFTCGFLVNEHQAWFFCGFIFKTIIMFIFIILLHNRKTKEVICFGRELLYNFIFQNVLFEETKQRCH